MLKNRPIAWLAAVVVAVAMATDAKAQGLPTSPGQEPFFKFQPFLDPGYFQPDFQFFSPAEVNDFGGEEKGNTGLYVTVDRTYVNVSRPIDRFSFGSGNQGDFTWGNRMEAGYMKDDGHGWQAGLWHVNGPNESFSSSDYIQRVSDANATLTINALTPGAINSLNNLKMSSFELNKTWRLKEFHNGTTMEPLLGYRYMNVRDYFTRQVLSEFPGTIGIPVYAIGDEFLQVISHNAMFENQMHGGQIGARIFRQRGHWLLSADARFFSMANFQSLKVVNRQSYLPNPDLQLVDGVNEPKIAPLGTPGGDVNSQVAYHRATQFVFGGEIRGEASYELTRDINLRFGFTFMDLGQGIGRGDLLRFNNQAVQMAGVTFGFTVNR